MCPHMPIHDVFPFEWFKTNFAMEWRFTYVNSDVSRLSTFLTKRLFTEIALKKSFVCVCTRLSFHIVGLSKAYVANFALVWFLS